MYGLTLTVHNVNSNESLPYSNNYDSSFYIPVIVCTESNVLLVPST